MAFHKQYTLRSMLLATLVVSCICVIFARNYMEYRSYNNMLRLLSSSQCQYSTEEKSIGVGYGLFRTIVGDIHEITSVYIDKYSIPNDELIYAISEQSSIRTLEIANGNINESQMKVLFSQANRGKLNRLCIGNSSVSKSVLQLLRESNLRELEISSQNSTQFYLALPELISVRSLAVYKCTIDDNAFSSIGQMQNLDSLKIAYVSKAAVDTIDDQDIAFLKDMNNLRTLELQFSSSITDHGLAQLCHLHNLESLSIPKCLATGSFWSKFKYPNKIKLFHSYASLIDDAGVKTLVSKCRNLEELSITSSRVTDLSILEIAKLSSLKKASFHASSISANGMKELSSKYNHSE